MASECPVALVKIDEYQVRVLALIVTLTAATYIWSDSVWLLALLCYDFTVRTLGVSQGSPIFLISRVITARLPFTAKPVDAGPKKFAAKIGFLFVTTALLLALAGYASSALWLMGLMTVFALLEAACGFCVGCKLYALLPRFLRESKRCYQ